MRAFAAAAAAWRDSAAAPFAGCGAHLSEFAGLDEAEAAHVGLKLSRTTPVRIPITGAGSLVLGCDSIAGTPVLSAITGDWFAPCALPTDRYEYDYANCWHLGVSADRMRALLDSLAVPGVLRDDRVASADTLSLTLRRSVGGRERIFECTLDAQGLYTLVRILANLFPQPRPDQWGRMPPEGIVRGNLLSWAVQLDPDCRSLWGLPDDSIRMLHR